MDFRLTEEQLALQAAARRFVRERLQPLAGQIDRDDAPPPRALVREYAAMGFLGINVSPEHGGLGLGNLEALLVLEEFAKCSSALAFPVFESCVGPTRAIERAPLMVDPAEAGGGASCPASAAVSSWWPSRCRSRMPARHSPT